MDDKILISSSSSPDSARPPPLLRLANELVDTIFDLVYTDSRSCRLARMAPCRHLVALQRTHLYRHVELGSYSALASFCRTMGSVSRPGETTVSLTLSLQGEDNFAPTSSVAGGSSRAAATGPVLAVPPPLVTPADFAALLRRLPRLGDVCADYLDAPLLGVLLDQAASGPLASLRRLVVQQDGPFVPLSVQGRETVAWAARLGGLPFLEDLTLRQYDNAVPVLRNVPGPPTFAHLKRLSLLADDCHSPAWAGPALDQMAPHVVDLELCDWYPVAWFASALATAPPELRELALKTEGEIADGGIPIPVHAVLARFPHLEHLELCAGAFDVSLPTALPSLLALSHLHTLAFSYESTDDNFLLALVQNPQHLPHLVRLDMSHTRSCRGRTVQEVGFFTHDDPKYNSYWPMWRGWRSPEYPPGCSEEARRAVTQAAQARGIIVVDTALGALGWQTAFDAEQRDAVLWYGDATGDYEPARKVLGDDLVDELLDLGQRAWLEAGEDVEFVEGDDGFEA